MAVGGNTSFRLYPLGLLYNPRGPGWLPALSLAHDGRHLTRLRTGDGPVPGLQRHLGELRGLPAARGPDHDHHRMVVQQAEELPPHCTDRQRGRFPGVLPDWRRPLPSPLPAGRRGAIALAARSRALPGTRARVCGTVGIRGGGVFPRASDGWGPAGVPIPIPTPAPWLRLTPLRRGLVHERLHERHGCARGHGGGWEVRGSGGFGGFRGSGVKGEPPALRVPCAQANLGDRHFPLRIDLCLGNLSHRQFRLDSNTQTTPSSRTK